MIGYLNGNLVSYEDGTVILSVGGVGFEIACSSSAYAKLLGDGGGEVYTYTAVKEDGISLYGFISAEEKKAFINLISVSGVGPKMGIAVLSQMSLAALNSAISAGDIKTLSAVKGLGKKTAERIILELKDKMGDGLVSDKDGERVSFTVSLNPDAVAALTSLGFTKSESESAVKKAMESGADSLEKIIAAALKFVR